LENGEFLVGEAMCPREFSGLKLKNRVFDEIAMWAIFVLVVFPFFMEKFI